MYILDFFIEVVSVIRCMHREVCIEFISVVMVLNIFHVFDVSSVW